MQLDLFPLLHIYIILNQRASRTHDQATKGNQTPRQTSRPAVTCKGRTVLVGNQRSSGDRRTCKSHQNANCHSFLYRNRHGRQPIVCTVYMQWHLSWKGQKKKSPIWEGSTISLPGALSLNSTPFCSQFLFVFGSFTIHMSPSQTRRVQNLKREWLAATI